MTTNPCDLVQLLNGGRKLIGVYHSPQGVMMGLLTAAGSLARATGPMSFSALYEHFGPYVTFGTIVGMFWVTILFILISSPRLIPYERYTQSSKAAVLEPA